MAEVVVDGVLVVQAADLCDEIDILSGFARPCAVDAEVALFVLAAAGCIGGGGRLLIICLRCLQYCVPRVSFRERAPSLLPEVHLD